MYASCRSAHSLLALGVCFLAGGPSRCSSAPPEQVWGNSTHIAPELHREANRVYNTALVAELHFDKQVSVRLVDSASSFLRLLLCATRGPPV